MLTTFQQQAHSETHKDIEKLIYRLCHQAVDRHGGDFNEYLSIANEAYIRAYDTYQSGYGASFSTWLYNILRNAISSYVKKENRQNMIQIDYVDSLEDTPQPIPFSISHFLSCLPTDATEVVKILTEIPRELIIDMLSFGDVRELCRDRLVRHLRSLDWTLERIAKSFFQIRRELNS